MDLPLALRDEFRLAPGDTLALESDGERMTLRPVRSASALNKEHGIWVSRSGRKLSTDETNRALENVRQERESRSARLAK